MKLNLIMSQIFLGLAYKQVENQVILFVTTTQSVLSYNTSTKDQRVCHRLHRRHTQTPITF
jgi:hypothetical protein